MTEPEIPHAIAAFDLVVPQRSLLSALNEPHLCEVCGQPTEWLRLAALRQPDRHASCRRVIDGYDRQVAAIDDDPDYVVADAAADEARTHAEQIWEDRLRGLGLPDWYVQRTLASREDAP